jgi:hypothetical protein
MALIKYNQTSQLRISAHARHIPWVPPSCSLSAIRSIPSDSPWPTGPLPPTLQRPTGPSPFPSPRESPAAASSAAASSAAASKAAAASAAERKTPRDHAKGPRQQGAKAPRHQGTRWNRTHNLFSPLSPSILITYLSVSFVLFKLCFSHDISILC